MASRSSVQPCVSSPGGGTSIDLDESSALWTTCFEAAIKTLTAQMAWVPRYGIQMRVHDRRCSAQSRSAKQKSKRKALQ